MGSSVCCMWSLAFNLLLRGSSVCRSLLNALSLRTTPKLFQPPAEQCWFCIFGHGGHVWLCQVASLVEIVACDDLGMHGRKVSC